MVQSALIFALGFMVAALLALLLAPVLWRRAQYLMRHRLEAVVPMTLDEVRADRDALRAEHAMAMRRLEVENEEIRAIDAEHLLEISRGQETLKARAATIEARNRRIEELNDQVRRLSAQIRVREREIAALEVSHRLASREVTARRERVNALTAALTELEQKAEASAQSLAARETSDAERADELIAARRDAATLTQREATLRGALGDAQAQLRTVSAEAERLGTALEAERRRAAALAADLAETDGTVREQLLDLAASVVRVAGGAEPAPPDGLPQGAIAARANGEVAPPVASAPPVAQVPPVASTPPVAPAPSVEPPVPEPVAVAPQPPAPPVEPAASEPDALPDDVLAEMDAAAAAELDGSPRPDEGATLDEASTLDGSAGRLSEARERADRSPPRP